MSLIDNYKGFVQKYSNGFFVRFNKYTFAAPQRSTSIHPTVSKTRNDIFKNCIR